MPGKPWVRVDCDLMRHPKTLALPDWIARAGVVDVLGSAKITPHPGTFASRAHFGVMVAAPFVPYLEDYIRAGWIELQADGSLSVHEWDRFQIDPTRNDRQGRFRERNGEVNADVTEKVTEKVTLPSRALSSSPSMSPSSSSLEDVTSRARAHEANPVFDLVELVEKLTDRPFGYTAGSKVWEALAADCRALGCQRVADAYRTVKAEANGTPLDAAGMVYGGHKALYPIPASGPPPTRQPKPKGLQPDPEEVRRAFRR